MSRAYIAHDDFVKAAKAGTVPAGVILRKQFVCEKAQAVADASSRKRTFIISTAAVDRDNDSISPKGWNLDNYRKNPVVLFAHDYSSLPIAKCVNVKMTGGKLIADCEFADHEMAETVLRLIDGGFLNATSVGFRPTKYSLNETRKGVDYEEQELLEYSVVPVPANPEALIVSRELIGDVKLLQAWAAKTLEVTKAGNNPPPDQNDGTNDNVPDNEEEDTTPAPPKSGKAPNPDQPGQNDDPEGDDDNDGDGNDPDPVDDNNKPNPDDKAAIVSAVKQIAAALKEMPVLVARSIKGGCPCMAFANHTKSTCACCSAGSCMGTCCKDDSGMDDSDYTASADGKRKAGRVLSAKNEAAIKAAHGHLSDVLSTLPPTPDDMNPPNSADNSDTSIASADGVVAKAGRVLSAVNENRVRLAHSHLGDVLGATNPPSPDTDDDGVPNEPSTRVVDGVVEKDLDIIDIDIDGFDDDEFDEKDVADAMAAAVKNALRTGIGDIVKQETQSALNRMRGRLD